MDSFGEHFVLEIYGASHDPVMGVRIHGVPAGIPVSAGDFLQDISRRRSGAKGTTARREPDIPRIVSGVTDGVSDGTGMVIEFDNTDIRSEDYGRFFDTPRPGHADFVSRVRYGKVFPGGGQFSGRMTLPLVAAGVVAKKIIAPANIEAQLLKDEGFEQRLSEAVSEGDSIGGVVECVCTGVPAGLGDPFFDPLESLISHIVFAIPGVRGVEFGDGFAAARMKGSRHNDPILDATGRTAENHAGGVNGGISNGNPIVFRVAVKPTSSISSPQRSFNFAEGRMEEFSIRGRHDSCFALRVPVIVESVAACAICDALLRSGNI